nr:GDP-fucose protein O-fucosyltransferase [Tanacetum cinerariifolium]
MHEQNSVKNQMELKLEILFAFLFSEEEEEEEEVEEELPRGFVTFSLTNGPEYHISQIANAVVVARYLRATLITPNIRGT